MGGVRGETQNNYTLLSSKLDGRSGKNARLEEEQQGVQAEYLEKLKSSMSVQPLSDIPYRVQGTSPFVHSGFSRFPSKITIGGIALPAALAHASIW